MLALEPSWLAVVAQQQQKPGDSEMLSCLRKARGANPSFTMREVHGFELCYRVAGGVSQLVIPRGQGLRQALMEEVHTSAYGAHLG